MNTHDILKALERELPPVLTRKSIPQLTGGLVAAGTLANHDSRGTGPAGAARINGHVTYSREAFHVWLAGRIHAKEDYRSASTGARNKSKRMGEADA